MMKKFYTILFIMSITIASATGIAFADAFWSAEEALPGKTSMFFGDGLENTEYVEISVVEDGGALDGAVQYVRNASPEKEVNEEYRPEVNYTYTTKSEAIQANATSVKFIIDENVPYGVYDIRPINKDGSYGKYFRINKPEVQWVQGISGRAINAGDSVRVTGKNLVFNNGECRLALIGADNNVIQLNPIKIYDEYSVEYKLPDNIAVGEYSVFVHNGFGGTTSWSEPFSISVNRKENTNQTIYNVKDYGAKGDGVTNDNAAILEAISVMKKNNGGILYFPRGRYMLTQPIELPRYSKIRGEKMEYSQIFWTAGQWDFNSIPPAMIKAKDNFSIEEISFYGSRMGSLIKADNNTETAGNIVIDRVNIKVNPFAGRTDTDYLINVMNEIDRFGNIWTIDMGGKNIRITNSTVYCGSCPLKITNGYNCYIKNNTFYNGYRGWWSLGGLQDSIMEDNQILTADLTSTGGSVNNLYGTNKCANYYFARNSIRTTAGNDREPFTLDGGGGGFVGNMLDIDKTILVLPESAAALSDNAYKECCVMIVAGKGMGQYREVVSNTKNTMQLSSPFTVTPDETSVFSMCGTNKNIYIVKNEIYDSGHLQLYGTSLNAVIDGNIMTRSSGINAWGQYVYGGYQPEMYIKVTNNEVYEGNYCHAQGIDDGWSGNAAITIRSTNEGTFQIADIVRNNVLHECSSLGIIGTNTEASIKDVIVENNTVKNHSEGIVIKGNLYGIFARNNQFENVTSEYDISDITNTEDRIIIR